MLLSFCDWSDVLSKDPGLLIDSLRYESSGGLGQLSKDALSV